MMKIVSIHNIQDFNFLQKDCFCCIGFFDGIHLGHQKILKQCVLDAKKEKNGYLGIREGFEAGLNA